MKKAEYVVNKEWCYIRCVPQEDKCKNCKILKTYKEIYGDKKYK